MSAELVAQLRDSFADWARWLVFADWLTDQGDARGELITLDHELATGSLSERQRRTMSQRVRALEQEHRASWLAGWPGPEAAQLEWRYGFVTGANLGWSSTVPAALDALVDHPDARLFTWLELRTPDPMGPEAAQALAGTRFLRTLSSLTLKNCKLGDEGAEALARPGALGRLTSLDLGSNGIGDRGLHALGASGAFSALTSLKLADNALSDEGMRALASAQALTSLDLRDNAIGADGACALAALPWRALRSLHLEGNRVRARGARALAASPAFSQLTELDLRRNAVGAGLQALQQSEHLRGCQVKT